MGTALAPNGPKRANLDSEVYSLAEFAALLGCSYTSIHEAAQRGSLPVEPVRFGRRYLIPKAAVHRLLGIDDRAQSA